MFVFTIFKVLGYEQILSEVYKSFTILGPDD